MYRRRDPYRIVRPQMFPAQMPCIMAMQAYGKQAPMHTHRVWVDKETGEGYTDILASHFHRVRENRMLPSDVDGHTHELRFNMPGGAGR